MEDRAEYKIEGTDQIPELPNRCVLRLCRPEGDALYCSRCGRAFYRHAPRPTFAPERRNGEALDL